MKNALFILTALFLSANVAAQRNVEKTEPLAPDEAVSLNFKFAEEVKIQQWEKDQVLVQATVEIDEGKGNESYSLVAERGQNELKIYSDFGEYFERKIEKNGYNCQQNKISYVVFVPTDVNLKIESISGDVLAETFQGNLETDLVAGDVKINKYSGKVDLRTVSGDLDVVLTKGDIDASTVVGTIYSDLDIAMEENRSPGTNRVRGQVNNGGLPVKLETVSGNIYMRSKL